MSATDVVNAIESTTNYRESFRALRSLPESASVKEVISALSSALRGKLTHNRVIHLVSERPIVVSHDYDEIRELLDAGDFEEAFDLANELGIPLSSVV